MPVVDVINRQGEKVSQITLADELFSVPVNKTVLHEVVTMQLASKRAGSASAKNRSEISGSTRKLYRQKGTGRARRGSIKSPLLRGGGVVFGPIPKSYAYRVPKKVRKLALKMALASKLLEDNLVVLDEFRLERIQTKDVATVLNALNLGSTLIVTEKEDLNLERSSRNIPDIKVLRSEGLNVYDILKYRTLVLLESSVESIQGRLLS